MAFPYHSNRWYLLTRRVKNGQFRLIPRRQLRQIFSYVLFLTAEEWGVSVAIAILMSNHYHLVVEDLYGRLGDFLRDFHARLYHALSEFQELEGHLWEPGRKPGRTRLEDTDAVWRKILYCGLNPVRANLEERSQDWAGTLFDPCDAGRTLTIARPNLVCLQKYAPTASLRVATPPGFNSHRDLRHRYRKDLRHQESLLAAEREEPVLTSEKALALPIETIPAKPLKRRPNPNFATRNPDTMKAAKQELRQFRLEYRAALEENVACARARKPPTAIFPAGTFAQHHYFGHPRHPT